jgi:uncharacterized repeat protein (TIGR03803 family)
MWVYTNSDGAQPQAGLVLSGSALYGMTPEGGPPGMGTVFKVNTNGSGYTLLKVFSAWHPTSPYPYTNSDGGQPQGGLVLSGSSLYGTTAYAGTGGGGTVFKLDLCTPLNVQMVDNQLVLSWTTNMDFSLQSASDGTGTFTNIPGATSPYTNPITGSQQFYRLIAN